MDHAARSCQVIDGTQLSGARLAAFYYGFLDWQNEESGVFADIELLGHWRIARARHANAIWCASCLNSS
jgi:hypothetical protein